MKKLYFREGSIAFFAIVIFALSFGLENGWQLTGLDLSIAVFSSCFVAAVAIVGYSGMVIYIKNLDLNFFSEFLTLLLGVLGSGVIAFWITLVQPIVITSTNNNDILFIMSLFLISFGVFASILISSLSGDKLMLNKFTVGKFILSVAITTFVVIIVTSTVSVF